MLVFGLSGFSEPLACVLALPTAIEVGFLPDDPLFAAVVKAHDATGELYMAMHYASCSGGVGCARMGPAPKS
jgi:hypothetical protein